MSASREKKSRRTDAHPADSNRLYFAVGIGFVIVAIVVLLYNSTFLQRRSVAATIDGEEFTAADVSYYYANMYSTYGSYASYMGTDYIKEMALESLKGTVAVSHTAQAEGYNIDEVLEQEESAVLELLDSYAEDAGFSDRADYLEAAFGSLMDEETFLRQIRLTTYANNFAADHYNAIAADTAALDAAYAADPASYDSVSARYVSITIPTTDGNAPTEEQIATARDTAAAIEAAWQAGGDLEALAEQYDALYYASDAIGNGSSPLPLWLFDESRQVGDRALIEGETRFYVAEFLGRTKNDYACPTVRHILITPETSTLEQTDPDYEADQLRLKEEARQQAEDILAQWQEDGASEEAFAQLASTYSQDSTASNGGLYSDIYKGLTAASFEAWCFAPERQAGDTGIVETQFGYHVMYYVGESSTPYWQQQAAEDLYEAWYTDITADITVEEGFGMKHII